MVRTLETEMMDGKVVRAIEVGETGKFGLTIEVYSQKIAVRVMTDDPNPLKNGEWVAFQGNMVVEEGKDIPYYHNPDDGSDRKEWRFYEMREWEYLRLPPPPMSKSLREAKNAILSSLGHWNDSEESLSSLESHLSSSLASVREFMQKRRETQKGSITIVTLDSSILSLSQVLIVLLGTRKQSFLSAAPG